MPRVGLIAYEVSADRLAAGMVSQLQQKWPDLVIEGVARSRVEALGVASLEPAEPLAVMGLFEVLRHLPRLLGARRRLLSRFLQTPPIDLFIGVDAPDFNLGMARRLRQQGVPTVQYVSPTVWAWRQGRVKALREATDLVLTIFPFEHEFLQSHGVNARYVGHPLAQEIPLNIDRSAARKALGLAEQGEVLAILPGSRASEIQRLAAPFLQAAALLAGRRPGLRFLLPATSDALAGKIRQIREAVAPGLDCQLLIGQADQAMSAADLVLTASGTATMETLLHKRPMVVGYRVNALSYWIFRRLIKVPYIAMANLLAGEALAPELIQHACQPEALASALESLLNDPPRRAEIAERYARIHGDMCLDSAALASEAVAEMLAARGT